MRIKGKVFSGFTALCVLLTFPVCASAAKADIQVIGGRNVRIITDFENLSGKSTDEGTALFGDGSSKGVDFSVKAGYGVDESNALVMGNVSADSYFAEASYNPNEDEMAKTEGLTDASDMIFYINGEGETNEVAFQIVFGEWDYDEDGNPVMTKNNDTGNMENAITFWKPADDINTVYYSLADGEDEWKSYTGTSQGYVRLPSGFKGYVRIPLSSFDPVWNSHDENDKIDLNHITRISFYYGMYNRHQTTGYAIAIDNIGFAGDNLGASDDDYINKPGSSEATGDEPSSIVATGDTREIGAVVLMLTLAVAVCGAAYVKIRKYNS